MKKTFTRSTYWLAGFGVGAAGMYFLDPQRGNRRRAEVKQQAVHLLREFQDALGVTSTDLVNRTRGTIASIRAQFVDKGIPDDDVLVARVRSRLGRVVAHPHSIEVHARGGKVSLSGICLTEELPRLLASVGLIRGVKEVENQLEAHESAEGIPSLQASTVSEGRYPGKSIDLLQTSWAPATRFLVGLAGGIGIARGLSRGGFGGYSLFGICAGLVARAVTNESLREAYGLRRLGSRSFIRVQKTINISAPVPQVYQFWANFENFPRFMSDVREVSVEPGTRRSHWVVDGPAGTPLSWDAVVTRQVPNELISWRSMPGSVIHNAGRVRFRPNETGGTRVDLDFSYHPPVGALGHAAATFLGAGPKGKLEQALAQMKTLIEEGPSRRQIVGLHAQGA